MKILHFLKGRCNPDTANGVEKTIYHLAMNQAALGHEVQIIGISPKPAIPIPGVAVRNYAPPSLPWRLPAGLLDGIVIGKPDIVHFHSIYVPSNVLLATALRKAGIPYVVTPHGNCARALLKRRPYLKMPYKWLMERPYLNRASFVHSMGDEAEIRHYGVEVSIVEIPNGIDASTLPGKGVGENAILKLKPGWQGKTIFTFVGRLDTEQKGLDLLLQGLRLAIDQRSNVGVVLVGPDWKGRRSGLEQLVQSLGLEDAVLFTGGAFGSQKYEYISSADFFVHTSRWEGMSFSVVEALACGRPCLITHAANPCRLIGKYDAGYLVDNDPPAIAKGIIALALTTRERREAMSAAALELVFTELSWKKIASDMTEAYRIHTCRGEREIAAGGV